MSLSAVWYNVTPISPASHDQQSVFHAHSPIDTRTEIFAYFSSSKCIKKNIFSSLFDFKLEMGINHFNFCWSEIFPGQKPNFSHTLKQNREQVVEAVKGICSVNTTNMFLLQQGENSFWYILKCICNIKNCLSKTDIAEIRSKRNLLCTAALFYSLNLTCGKNITIKGYFSVKLNQVEGFYLLYQNFVLGIWIHGSANFIKTTILSQIISLQARPIQQI